MEPEALHADLDGVSVAYQVFGTGPIYSPPASASTPLDRAGAYHSLVDKQTDKPLFSPDNQARWEEINGEEARWEVQHAASLSMAERVAHGQKLSQQAVALLASSAKVGHVPQRALRS